MGARYVYFVIQSFVRFYLYWKFVWNIKIETKEKFLTESSVKNNRLRDVFVLTEKEREKECFLAVEFFLRLRGKDQENSSGETIEFGMSQKVQVIMLEEKRDKNGDSVQLHARRDAIVARIIICS